MLSSYQLTNGNVRFRVAGADAVPELAFALESFLAPYFWREEAGGEHFRLIFRPFCELPSAWRRQAHTPVLIRRSTAHAFNLAGRSFSQADGSLVVVDDATETAYAITYPDQVVFYGGAASQIHLYEFVRYTSLLVEESLGTMLLHASATVSDGAAYLVLGEKGAGKTTTLLHLILERDHRYLSGDKVLVSAGAGGLLARGWPDYPHIGMGTLNRFPALAAACGVATHFADGSAKPPSHKELIDPLRFRAALPFAGQPATARVAALIYPAVSDAPTQVVPVAQADKAPALLADYIEYPHQFATVKWHRLFDSSCLTTPSDYRPLLQRLAEVPWLRVSGEIDLPRAALSATCWPYPSRHLPL